MENPFKIIQLQQSVLPDVIFPILLAIYNFGKKNHTKVELPPASNSRQRLGGDGDTSNY